MLSVLSHRGPEGAASARLDQGALLLGFLRLGFTDQGTCQQPLFNEDHTVALVYNGEIYDYAPLRERLRARGHTFRTASDSEVIVHLYEEYGERMFEHMNGEYAFVIWDGRPGRQCLFMARDRFGVKPLFYAWHRGALVVASEAKAILSLDGFSPEYDPAYFAGPGVGIAECAMTPFVGIRSLRPGHQMRVTRRSIEVSPYWKPQFGHGEKERLSLEEAAVAVRRELTRAVERRLEENPPIGVCLSSGLDSTIVGGLAARDAARRGRALTAFSVGYANAPYDESRAAEQTARHFGMGFERVLVTPDDLAKTFLPAMGSIEVPTNSVSAAARISLAKAVRRTGLKAWMTGEGSDELFGGYPYFGVEALWRMRDRPETAALGATLLAKFRREEAASRGIFWNDLPAGRATGLFGYPSAYADRVERVTAASRWLFCRSWRDAMGSATPRLTATRELDTAWMRALHPFDATRVIARSVLGSLIIPGLGDRVEMAGSLEGRVPYLDTHVVDLAYSLDEAHMIDPRTLARKRVLRTAFREMLPPTFRPPAKTTLMAPTFSDLAGTPSGRGLFELLLSDKAIRKTGVFDPLFVRGVRLAWRLLPKTSSKHVALDLLIGYMMSTQALHHVLVEDGLGMRRNLKLIALEDRSPKSFVSAAPAMA